MQTSDIINLITGKKKITKKDIDELVALTNKYPYFETFYNIILHGAKDVEKENLENIINKFSIYIVDRKKIISELFLKDNKVESIVPKENEKENVRKKILKRDDFKKNRDKKKDQEQISDNDIAFYERQKKKHENVLRDFFSQKVKKMTKISELLKTEKSNSTDAETSSIDQISQKVASIKNQEQDTQEKEVIIEKGITSNEVEDDIFAKIAKLKKEKIDSQINKVDEKEKSIVEEKIDLQEDKKEKSGLINEKSKGETIKKEDLKIREEISEEKEDSKEIEEKQENLVIENKEIKEEEKIEIENESGFVMLPDEDEDKEIEEKIESEQTKDYANKSAADLILDKLRNRKKSYTDESSKEPKTKVSADDVLNKLKNKKLKEQVEQKKEIIEEPIKEEKIEHKKQFDVDPIKKEQVEEKKQLDVEPIKEQKKEKIIEPIKKEQVEEKDEKIIAKKEESKDDNKEIIEIKQKTEETEAPKSDKPKSAADRILERIQMRKKTSQTDIIDQFLVKQPKIEGKKEPEHVEDLAQDSIKEVEVATERLAEIYTLQGLNDKAIEIYEKLILKYPEKRTYFAQKISELKNKI